MFKKVRRDLLVMLIGFLIIVLSPLYLCGAITVGVYYRGSDARFSYRELITAFLIDDEICIEKVTAADVANDRLNHLDVFVVTEFGLQGENTTPVDFGDLGKRKVREFIENGGVYIGIGMGAKLGIKTVEKGFRLVDVERIPVEETKRGILKARLSPDFDYAFPELKSQRNVYVYLDSFSARFRPGENSRSIFDFSSSAVPELNGSSILTKSCLGRGMVFLTSWMIHKTPGMKWIFPRLVRLGTDGKIRDYSRYVNSNFYSREFLFTDVFKKQQDYMVSKLKVAMAAKTDGQIAEVLSSMHKLSQGRYFNFLPHIVGRLRNQHKNVKKRAAEIIKEWQYFAGVRDLWAAIKEEEDLTVLKTMLSTYDDFFLNFRGTDKDLRGAENMIKVAIYDDHGIGALDNGVAIRETLKMDPLIKAVIIDAADIAEGFLDKVDVLISPGGSGSGTGSMLGAEGLERVKRFVKDGGGYLGYCAGAYLGTASYKWSLHLLNAASFDRAHWARGGAIAQVKIEEKALEVFPEFSDKNIVFQKFWQGPLLVEGDYNLPSYDVMLTFLSDIHHRQPRAKGATLGKAWLIKGQVGHQGRVVLCSGHPEQTPGSRYFTPRLVRWLVKKQPIPYEGYMDPFKYDSEFMYDETWKKHNDSLISAIVESQNHEEVARALRSLSEKFHRAPWFVPGFLRSRQASLRKLAAELIVELQIFWARKDVEVAYSTETDPAVREAMKKALDFMISSSDK